MQHDFDISYHGNRARAAELTIDAIRDYLANNAKTLPAGDIASIAEKVRGLEAERIDQSERVEHYKELQRQLLQAEKEEKEAVDAELEPAAPEYIIGVDQVIAEVEQASASEQPAEVSEC